MHFQSPLICTLVLLLSGCGGGGGGSAASGNSTLAPFVKFSAIALPSGAVSINGMSRDASYSNGSGIAGVTTLTAGAAYNVAYSAGIDAPSIIDLTTAAGRNINFDRSHGDSLAASVAFSNTTLGVNGQTRLLTPNIAANGWDYQSFGVWATGFGTGSGSVGVVNFGAETAGAAIPTTGTGSYVGVSGGLYVDSGGTAYFTKSDMSANANFGTRAISFVTSNTQTSSNLVNTTANTNLNMTGTLNYGSGVNQFSGNVTSTGSGVGNAAMTGTSTGKFYGPAAQEIGGTFVLTGGGSSSYLGAFGGKK